MEKETSAIAYGRIGLLGNPSDIYGGKCISFTFNKHAKVIVKDFDKLEIIGNGGVDNDLTYNGSNDLIKATIRKLNLNHKRLNISYDSGIPLGSGLAGSSAIIIAAIKAIKNHLGLNLDEYEIAELALHTEIDELGISAGFQDRYAISFGGVNYLDFSGKEYMRREDEFGKVKRLEVNEIPFFLSLGVQPKSSAIIHNPLREQFLKGGFQAVKIKTQMDEIAKLADEGIEPINNKDWKRLGELMNKNTELRNNICPSLKKDIEMIKKAIDYGALGAKVAGSGGAIVILTEENDPENVFEKMCKDYPSMKPKISSY